MVKVKLFSDSHECLGESDFEYEDMKNKFVSQAVQSGPDEVSNLVVQLIKRLCNQSSSTNQSSFAMQNSGEFERI